MNLLDQEARSIIAIHKQGGSWWWTCRACLASVDQDSFADALVGAQAHLWSRHHRCQHCGRKASEMDYTSGLCLLCANGVPVRA